LRPLNDVVFYSLALLGHRNDLREAPSCIMGRRHREFRDASSPHFAPEEMVLLGLILLNPILLNICPELEARSILGSLRHHDNGHDLHRHCHPARSSTGPQSLCRICRGSGSIGLLCQNGGGEKYSDRRCFQIDVSPFASPSYIEMKNRSPDSQSQQFCLGPAF
jgi:hypothetical protein